MAFDGLSQIKEQRRQDGRKGHVALDCFATLAKTKAEELPIPTNPPAVIASREAARQSRTLSP